MDENIVPVPVVRLGHNLKHAEYRSEDVLVGGNEAGMEFEEFDLSAEIIRGLLHEGFEKPSPIQLSAIPVAKLGNDMLMQSKSGTGKTIVFTVVALERVICSLTKIQALVLCPSREIAIQTQNVIKCIGAFKPGLKTNAFIGGTSVMENLVGMEECHVMVGTPGRLAHLIRDYNMDLSSVQVFVIDEADKLLDHSFSVDLGLILNSIPGTAQILAVSATFEDPIPKRLDFILRNPIRIHLDVGGTALIGIEQHSLDVKTFYEFIPEEGQSIKVDEIAQFKFKAILEILSTVSFRQAIIFSTFQLRAEKIYDDLREGELDVVLLSGALSQTLRNASFLKFQRKEVDILVATDLAARGLDYGHVDLVINYEVPLDLATYIHRMGRAGRFGSFGRCITLIGFNSEAASLNLIRMKANLQIDELLEPNDFNNLKALQPTSSQFRIGSKRQKRPKKTSRESKCDENESLSLSDAAECFRNGGPHEYGFALTHCRLPLPQFDTGDPNFVANTLTQAFQKFAKEFDNPETSSDDSWTSDESELLTQPTSEQGT